MGRKMGEKLRDTAEHAQDTAEDIKDVVEDTFRGMFGLGRRVVPGQIVVPTHLCWDAESAAGGSQCENTMMIKDYCYNNTEKRYLPKLNLLSTDSESSYWYGSPRKHFFQKEKTNHTLNSTVYENSQCGGASWINFGSRQNVIPAARISMNILSVKCSRLGTEAAKSRQSRSLVPDV
jgi:hypothetical protein